MAEYIEKAELIKKLCFETAEWYYSPTIKTIKEFPVADVQPVKRGRWISSGRDNDYNSYCRCSRCNNEIVMYRDSEKNPPNYCDNCGARMDGDTNG